MIISTQSKNFCTGLDLEWLNNRCYESLITIEENTKKLEEIFKILNNISIIKIAIIQGKIIGAGIGIISCCDLVFAKKNCEFYLPEIKIGILPAVILPYLAKTIGNKKALAYTLCQKKWDINQALADGLVHEIIKDDAKIEIVINNILNISKNELIDLLKYNDLNYSSAQLLAKAIFNNKNKIKQHA